MKKMGIIINNFRCALPLLFCLTVSLLSSSVSSELSQSQKNTMLNLSKLLHNQTSMISWNTDSDPCSSWSGVTCRNVTTTISSVSMLSFANLDLTNSSFLPLACQIDTLESIDVSKNELTSIPDGFFMACRRIQGLKLVNFSFNHISGPLPSFSSGFTNLESLDLSYNSFSGSIGSQLSDLVSLKLLNLNFNAFSGSVPTKLGKSMVLEQLVLSGNNFQGSIPEQLADYKNLTVLDLGKNKLTGNVPSRIGQLSKLEILVLSDNSLSGEVPNFISKIRTLKRFAANQNSFTGAIPSGISMFLKYLDLSYNNLSGSMPNDLLAQPNLQTVDLSYNKLKGSIPGNVSSSLVRLRLGSNSLNGSISLFNCAQLQNLVYLELENNLLSGSIPTHLDSCWNLRLLSLGGNKFSGELPAELGNLKQLQVLSLQLNKFVGRIPHEITTLSHLSTLNISWNLLNGSIPPSISGLTNLAYLHLQGNHLSGVIPGNISDMNSLIELQLGNNQLSGYITPMPRNLQYALNLSGNLFEGRIPESLYLLNSLEILDLSNNRFSGEIPKFLSKMESLTTVLLNNNNLSGVVPAFSPNVKVHFAGNPLLVIPESSPRSTPLLRDRVRLNGLTITALIAAVTAGGLIAIIAIFLSKRLIFRANDLAVQPRDEDYPLSQPVETLILTANSIHKANIDFTTAIETVANPLNLVLTTRFSSYYKVIMPSGLSYFVKKLNLRDETLQPGSLENFGQKLRALGKLNSTNIMTPLAFMLAGESAYLFYEMAFIGSLFDLLHGNCGIPLDWASRFSIAVGVAQGLTSLHGRLSGPILHFDLTSKTIMLKSPKQPQIGDIELYKVIDPSKSTSSLSAVAGSIGYIPPGEENIIRSTCPCRYNRIRIQYASS